MALQSALMCSACQWWRMERTPRHATQQQVTQLQRRIGAFEHRLTVYAHLCYGVSECLGEVRRCAEFQQRGCEHDDEFFSVINLIVGCDPIFFVVRVVCGPAEIEPLKWRAATFVCSFGFAFGFIGAVRPCDLQV